LLFAFGFGVLLLHGGAENVAERSARVGGAILGDRLALVGDFERLDRGIHFARLGIEESDLGVELLANRETLGPLFGTVAGEIGALDIGRHVGAGDADLEAILLDLHDFTGDGVAFLDAGSRGYRIAAQLLDT